MTIKLNKEIYTLEHIRQTLADYSDLAVVYLSEDNVYYLCKFSGCKYDEQLTAKEFVNYVTDLMNHSRS